MIEDNIIRQLIAIECSGSGAVLHEDCAICRKCSDKKVTHPLHSMCLTLLVSWDYE